MLEENDFKAFLDLDLDSVFSMPLQKRKEHLYKIYQKIEGDFFKNLFLAYLAKRGTCSIFLQKFRYESNGNINYKDRGSYTCCPLHEHLPIKEQF